MQRMAELEGLTVSMWLKRLGTIEVRKQEERIEEQKIHGEIAGETE